MTDREPDFVHLHVHSHYSLLDGACRIQDLVSLAARDGQKALAISDHGNLFGAVEFHEAAARAGIKPILGIEAYVAARSRREKGDTTDNPTCHLTLLARDETGWKNLMKLSSLSYTEGFYYKPRMDREILAAHASGLIALSGCLSGEVNRRVMAGDTPGAVRAAAEHQEIFGKENFYLEVMENGYEPQRRSTAGLAALSRELGIPLAATNDVHYLTCNDSEVQDIALCIATGKRVQDENRMRMGTDQLYFKTRREMARLFEGHPQALRSTVEIAERCDLKLDFGSLHLPVFETGTSESARDMFRRLCLEGARARYGEPGEAVAARLRREMEVIERLGFVDYFLIVWDFIRFARANDVPVGPGRGSAAGSLVAYCLGIADVDPLRYGLLFERFLNAERISMPDIDIDFCRDGREKVIEYVRRKYGPENVCQIITFGTMASRGVLRDVGRALDLPLAQVDRIAKKVPQGPGASLGRALETDPEVKALREESEETRRLFDIGLKLEGLPRHASTHAAGVVLADKPLTEYVPLCKNGEDVITQWQMEDIEKVGLLKMDFLGLKTLTIIRTATDLVRETEGVELSMDDLPLDDPATFRLLCSGEALGVFQLESSGMRELLVRLKPDKFEDLIALLALYRPGPLGSGMVDMYVRRKHGEEAVEYPHPSLRPILEETYGVIVYQEQVMLIANELAGFSLNEADSLRKAMGKKKPEVMAAFKAQFVEGAKQRGHDPRFARELFEMMEFFAGYGFNKSHSAAYAMLTYRTAYLKANHPLPFLCAVLTCEAGNTDKVREFVEEARRMGCGVLPPDVNRSRARFSVEEGSVRFGLAAIKGIGWRAAEALVLEREEGDPFGGLTNLCERLDPALWNKASLEALVHAGALDGLGAGRAAALAALEPAMRAADALRRDRRRGQANLFAAAAAAGSREEGVLPPGAPAVAEWSEAERLAREKAALGFYLSGHPIQKWEAVYRRLAGCDTSALASLGSGAEVRLAGMIAKVRTMNIRTGRNAGQKMARLRLEDSAGAVDATVFARTYAEVKDRLREDTIVFVRGRMEGNGEEPSLLVEEILDVPEALTRWAGALILTLPEEVAKEDARLDRVLETLERHRGDTLLLVEVVENGSRARIRADRACGVTVTEALLEELAAVLPPSALALARDPAA